MTFCGALSAKVGLAGPPSGTKECCLGDESTVAACIATITEGGRVYRDKRVFGTTTKDLLELSDWLAEHSITHVGMGIHWGVLCAEQRVVREGSSPSGARMRSVISERGGNASRAGEKRKAGVAKAGTKANAGRLAAETSAVLVEFLGGQGVHREVESEGHEEKYRVVVEGAIR